MGSAMAERLRAAGRHGRRLQPDAGAGERAGRADRRQRRGDARPRRPPRADVVISMVADDAAVAALYDGPDGVRRRPPARGRGGRHEHRPARHRPVARASGPRARRRHPRRAGVGQRVARTRRASSTIMVGGEAATSSAPGPSSRRLARRVFHLGGAGHRRRDEARGQHRHLRAQRGRSPRASSWPSAAASSGPRLRGPRRECRGRPVRRLQAGRVRRAGHDAGRVLARTRREGPAPHRRARPSATGSWRCPRPPRTSTLIRAAERSVGGDADFSMVASHLREEGRR